MAKSEGKEGIVQFVKFAVVGVANTAVDWIVYYVLINTLLEGDKTFAKAISFIVAVLNSFLWNSVWTFKKEFNSASKGGGGATKFIIFTRFFVVSLVGWGVNYFAFKFTLSKIAEPDIYALIVASGAAVLWNFFANKFWTYKK